MERNFSDAVGLALLIIALAAGLSIGVYAVVRSDLAARNFEVSLEDKTAQEKYSPDAGTDSYDGTFSRGEVYLAAAIQDSGMAGSRTITIGSRTVTVDSSTVSSDIYMKYANACIKDKGSTARFGFRYRYQDGSYELYND
jgi:hypothetical protein